MSKLSELKVGDYVFLDRWNGTHLLKIVDANKKIITTTNYYKFGTKTGKECNGGSDYIRPAEGTELIKFLEEQKLRDARIELNKLLEKMLNKLSLEQIEQIKEIING